MVPPMTHPVRVPRPQAANNWVWQCPASGPGANTHPSGASCSSTAHKWVNLDSASWTQRSWVSWERLLAEWCLRVAVWGCWWLLLFPVLQAPPQVELCLLTGLEEEHQFQEAPVSRSPGGCVYTLGASMANVTVTCGRGCCGQSPRQGVGHSPRRGRGMGSLTLWRTLMNSHRHTPVPQSSPSRGPSFFLREAHRGMQELF